MIRALRTQPFLHGYIAHRDGAAVVSTPLRFIPVASGNDKARARVAPAPKRIT